ncbi:FAD-dependent oxidoreductase [Micromonospora ureilytica]|uniref:2-polyprenyl-6-methoxyphenol hydroxylase-like FAD-dependent oxidoreductase n=1 Tax=Micromonospora ureilytica TaxID=709868 RepID=A0ABS0JG97_9ACTN|nr:FAD-dependent oxidoreductase [Micromonospora ureilytica]MBG6065501.1 2-polyprenyl-6-methoxyphenol hydroxylase-like FAD-dependent oxidoreductase [Micromonospora ureilytica]
MDDSHAVVVGGGIGGLSAALALHRHGWRVTVLERAPELREVGAGLSLMANAVRALDALGLGPALRRGGHGEAPGGMRNRHGRWLSRVDASEMIRQLGTTALGVHRATLHRTLREALPASSLHTNATVEHVESGPDHAEVRYQGPDGPHTLTADLVVGADGLRSRVRAQLWPQHPGPVYAGSTTWRAAIAFPDPIPAAITWGPGAEFGMVPIGDGQLYWYGAVNAPPGGHAPDELAAVREHFGGWHDPIPALLAATPPEAVLRNDIHYLAAPLPSYVRGRVALLGDAAHPMTPNLGQGAGQAIEDAVVLGAVCAGGAEGVPAALAAYDEQRRPRSQSVARASYVAGRLGQQLHNPIAFAMRNIALRLTPGRVALRSMARYADWRPPAG